MNKSCQEFVRGPIGSLVISAWNYGYRSPDVAAALINAGLELGTRGLTPAAAAHWLNGVRAAILDGRLVTGREK